MVANVSNRLHEGVSSMKEAVYQVVTEEVFGYRFSIQDCLDYMQTEDYKKYKKLCPNMDSLILFILLSYYYER